MKEKKEVVEEKSEAERRGTKEEIDKIVKNPHYFGYSFGQVVQTLQSIGGTLEDAIRAGKHPHFCMDIDSIKDKWDFHKRTIDVFIKSTYDEENGIAYEIQTLENGRVVEKNYQDTVKGLRGVLKKFEVEK